MERRKMLLEKSSPYLQYSFNKSMAQLINDFQTQGEKFNQAHLACLDQYFKSIQTQQEQGHKEAIAYIFVSCLRSYQSNDQYSYRLDAYDSLGYLDKIESSTYWSADFIWRYLQNDLAYLTQELKNQRIYDYEQDWLKIQHGSNYHLVTYQYWRATMTEILALPSYQQLDKSPEISIHFGEYQSQSILLYQGENSETGEGDQWTTLSSNKTDASTTVPIS